jgi:hypothetical protein
LSIGSLDSDIEQVISGSCLANILHNNLLVWRENELLGPAPIINSNDDAGIEEVHTSAKAAMSVNAYFNNLSGRLKISAIMVPSQNGTMNGCLEQVIIWFVRLPI